MVGAHKGLIWYLIRCHYQSTSLSDSLVTRNMETLEQVRTGHMNSHRCSPSESLCCLQAISCLLSPATSPVKWKVVALTLPRASWRPEGYQTITCFGSSLSSMGEFLENSGCYYFIHNPKDVGDAGANLDKSEWWKPITKLKIGRRCKKMRQLDLLPLF